MRLLGWDNEGVKVAQWLNTKGIAALVLKYRTLQTMRVVRIRAALATALRPAVGSCTGLEPVPESFI